MGKVAKPWFAISLELKKKNKKKKPCLPALKNFPMLGETNNHFYLASPIFEIKIIASYSKMQEAHLYAKFKGEIYTPYIGISLVRGS